MAAANEVTAQQVQTMGRKYFAARDQSIVIVGDARAIDAQLKPYGTFTTFKR